jgi:hypothetical protein
VETQDGGDERGSFWKGMSGAAIDERERTNEYDEMVRMRMRARGGQRQDGVSMERG